MFEVYKPNLIVHKVLPRLRISMTSV